MRKIHFLTPFGIALILILWIAAVSCASGDKGKIPITTTSETAKKHFLTGRELSENILFTESREYFDKAIAEDPNFALAYLYAANNSLTFNEFNKHLEKAEALADQVSEGEKLMIQVAVAGANADQTEVRKILLKLVELYPDDERVHFLLALNYDGFLENDLALKHYNLTTSINPNFAPVYNNMGYFFRRLNKYDEAEKAFLSYIKLIPNDPNPYDSYAELLLKMGRFDESIKQYQKALDVNANFNISRYGIATNLCLKDDYKSAHAQVDTAIAKARDIGEKRASLTAKAVILLDEENSEDAIAVLNKRMKLAEDTNDPQAVGGDLRLRAFIYQESGQYDKAAIDIEASRDIILAADLKESNKDQSKANYLFDMAFLYAYMGEFEKAVENSDSYMKYAMERKNANLMRAAHLAAGVIALKKGDYDAAIVELNKTNLQNPYNLCRLAMAYQGKGDIDKAREYCDQVINFNAVNSLVFVLAKNIADDMLAEL